MTETPIARYETAFLLLILSRADWGSFVPEIEEKLMAALSKNLPFSIIKVLPPPPFDLFQKSSETVQDFIVSKLK